MAVRNAYESSGLHSLVPHAFPRWHKYRRADCAALHVGPVRQGECWRSSGGRSWAKASQRRIKHSTVLRRCFSSFSLRLSYFRITMSYHTCLYCVVAFTASMVPDSKIAQFVRIANVHIRDHIHMLELRRISAEVRQIRASVEGYRAYAIQTPKLSLFPFSLFLLAHSPFAFLRRS